MGRKERRKKKKREGFAKQNNEYMASASEYLKEDF